VGFVQEPANAGEVFSRAVRRLFFFSVKKAAKGYAAYAGESIIADILRRKADEKHDNIFLGEHYGKRKIRFA
jgi:hypothetical protein